MKTIGLYNVAAAWGHVHGHTCTRNRAEHRLDISGWGDEQGGIDLENEHDRQRSKIRNTSLFFSDEVDDPRK